MGAWRDKVVLVTGASQGLGRVIACTFAESGARVVLAARGAEALSDAADSLQSAGHEVLAVPTDVTCPQQVESLVEQTIAHFGRLDVLVNNAGRSSRGELARTTAEQVRELMDVNFISAVSCTQAALPHLEKTRGSIVNIGSLASKAASRFIGAYATTKFALAAYSQQLRLELEEAGVHVMLVCPGPIAGDEPRRRSAEEMEGLPDSARRPGAGVRLSGIRPEKIARAIVAGCERRKPELVFPARLRVLFALGQLFPSLGDWLVKKMT